MSSSSITHKHRYKNVGLDSTEMRRRREEEGIQLRKQKREEQLIKRRNVDNYSMEGEIDSTVPVRKIRKKPKNFILLKIFNFFCFG